MPGSRLGQPSAEVGQPLGKTASIDTDLERLAPFLAEHVPGVTDAERIDGKVRLAVDRTDGVLPAVVTAAEAGGFEIRDVSVNEPTLESVFINLTGRDLRE